MVPPSKKTPCSTCWRLPFEAGNFALTGQQAMLSDWTSAEELAPANQPAGALALPFPVTAEDFLFTTFDAAPTGLAIDEAVPNPHDPLLTRVGQQWVLSNGDGAALPGKSRFVMLAVTAAATPAPPGALRTVEVVNTTRKIVTVNINSVPAIEDFVDPQSTQKFEGVPDGAQVTVRGGATIRPSP